jgi:hypothetical protein
MAAHVRGWTAAHVRRIVGAKLGHTGGRGDFRMGEPLSEEIEALRGRAREMLRAGRLPHTKAVRTWGGRGSGAPCELCGMVISSSEPEFEVQLELTSSAPSLRFHRACHAVWETARAEAEVGWTQVSERLPPVESRVEARIMLGAGRAIILNLICRMDPQSGPTWINATTLAPLPEGWMPLEWRARADEAASGPAESSLSRSA